MNQLVPVLHLHSRLTKFVLPIAVLIALTACGGGGGGGDDGGNNNPPPAAATIANGQLTLERIQGLGFSAPGAGFGRTDGEGKFQFVVGAPLEFFLGENNNRLKIGSMELTPAAAGGVTSASLHDLKEVQNDQDQHLGNLLALLVALDANADPTDGVSINAATNSAVSAAVAGKTVNFNQAAAAFKADPVIASLLTALNRQLGDAKAALADYSELFPQSRSSSIVLTSDNTRVVAVNRQKATASVIRVRGPNGEDVAQKLAEIPVGKEPRYVAVSPDDKRAFVTSAIDGTMTVIDLLAATPAAVDTVDVGLEPRGLAITPNGTYAFVANHTVGEVTVVRLSTLEVVRSIKTGGNPQAVAITNDGDKNDLDEQVYVTRMFGELIDPSRPDGFDDAKQGIIDTFSVGGAVDGTAQIAQLTLAPFDSGFAADRRQFCPDTRAALQASGEVVFFNSGAQGTGNGAAALGNTTFCPNLGQQDPAATGSTATNPQKVYPNMLFSALVRGRRLYVPNVGASPEPPVRFNVNVQGLVGVIDRTTGQEDTTRSLNLNAQVAKEKTPPTEAEATQTLDKLFLNDLVAADADRGGRNFLFVSRGGNYVLRAALDVNGKLNILDGGAPPKAVRLQTGNLPTGIVMSGDSKRAYANNELNMSVTAIDLTNNAVLTRDIPSSSPFPIDSQEHRNLVGKLVFFTALGVPDVMDTDDNGVFDIALADINPLEHRGKASDNAWSSCASCHDDGHSDNVTWIFETGPRQTIGLEGMFTHDVEGVKERLKDQRILNWSAVRGSNTDFNQNAIGIQGGKGFARNVNGVDRSALVFNHGPVFGVSDSLDALQEWAVTIRAPKVPQVSASHPGREVFADNCASCHGGAKWTKSQTTPLFLKDGVGGLAATFPQNPLGAAFFTGGVQPFDSFVEDGEGLKVNGPQLLSITRGSDVLTLLDDVGTFVLPNDPTGAGQLEIRGAAAIGAKDPAPPNGPGVQSTQGFKAFGELGFNSPSLLGMSMSAPYLHDGSAATLEAVFQKHRLPNNNQTIADVLSAQEEADLLTFLRSIDDATPAFQSDADAFPLPQK